jgi:hypothetical protein
MFCDPMFFILPYLTYFLLYWSLLILNQYVFSRKFAAINPSSKLQSAIYTNGRFHTPKETHKLPSKCKVFSIPSFIPFFLLTKPFSVMLGFIFFFSVASYISYAYLGSTRFLKLLKVEGIICSFFFIIFKQCFIHLF